MREVISIHVGQAGCQIGNSAWEVYSHVKEGGRKITFHSLIYQNRLNFATQSIKSFKSIANDLVILS